MDSVHGTVDHAGPVHRGPVAIVACPISSELNLRPLRLPGLSYEGRRRERGARGSRFRAHQGSEGDGVATCRWSRWWWGELRCGLLEAQKWGKEAVGGGDAGAPFYNVGGGAGRPGVGGERVAAVVRHSGGGNHFGRGSTRVVVGSDEGGALAVTGAEGAPGGGAPAREAVATAVAVGLGWKTTGRGPHVGERGRLAS
jgi:hypothetical protein